MTQSEIKQALQKAIHQRNYAQMALLQSRLKKSVSVERVQMGTMVGSMTDQDRTTAAVCANGIAMLCDLIDGFAIDLNSIIKRYDPTARVQTFDKIIELGRACREHLKTVSDVGEDFAIGFGDAADKIKTTVVANIRNEIYKTRT